MFTKIIKGEIPAHKIYEDDKTLAFLDIHPLMPGHVLVIPKNQVDHIEDLGQDDYQALYSTVKKVSSRVREIMGTKRVVTLVMGYDVPHAHVHVLPSDSGQDFYDAIGKVHDAMAKEPDHDQLAKIADRLKFNG